MITTTGGGSYISVGLGPIGAVLILPTNTMNTLDDILFIFLDDLRDPPSDEWVVVRTAETAYEAILAGNKADKDMVVSLDHDLGEDIPTGYDLVKWIYKDIATDEDFRPKISFLIHSMNPVGRENMVGTIKSIERML